MKHARLYSALPRVSAPRVRSNSAASTSRALSLASSFFDAPPQTGPPPPNTRLTTHRLPIEARGEVEGPNSASNAQAGRDAPLALVAPPHTPGNGHNTNHHHPHAAQLGALLFPGAPNQAGRHAASAPPPSGRVGRRRGQRYTLDVGAYGIPKRGNGHGHGQRVRGMHTHTGGYGGEVTDAPLAVQVGEDAYFVRENAMGVADGVGGWARVKHAAPPTGPSASALFARRLMHFCADEVERASSSSHPHASQVPHPEASTSKSGSPPVVTPWRAAAGAGAGAGYSTSRSPSRFAPYPMAATGASAFVSASASASASPAVYGSAPSAAYASTSFAPWHDPLYDNPWRDASSSSSSSPAFTTPTSTSTFSAPSSAFPPPSLYEDEYSDYAEYDAYEGEGEEGAQELLAAELDELADGLDVLRILERAYERTLGAHVVTVPVSDGLPMNGEAGQAPIPTTPMRTQGASTGESLSSTSTSVPRARPWTTTTAEGERETSTSLPSRSPLSVASASASARVRAPHPHPQPHPHPRSNTQQNANGNEKGNEKKGERNAGPKTIPLLAGSSTALVAVLDYVPRGEVEGFEFGVLDGGAGQANSKDGVGVNSTTAQARGGGGAKATEDEDESELTPVLKIAHVGDCMGMLVREGAVRWRSEEMWWRWNTPVQLSAVGAYSAATPDASVNASAREKGGRWWEAFSGAAAGASNASSTTTTTTTTKTHPQQQQHAEVTPSSAAHLFTLPVRAGDIVILASDGLSDNLWDEDVLEEVGRVGRAWAGSDSGSASSSDTAVFEMDVAGDAGAGVGVGSAGVDSARLRRRTLAGMLSEALCSRARRVATRRAGREGGRRCVVVGAGASTTSSAAAVNPPEAGKDESADAFEDEDDTPFARRARETGKVYRGGKNDDISVIVAVIAPAEEHARVGRRRMEAARAAGS